MTVEHDNLKDMESDAESIAEEIADEFCGGSEAARDCILAKIMTLERAGDQRAGQQPSAEGCVHRRVYLVAEMSETDKAWRCDMCEEKFTLRAVPAQPLVSATSLADENRPCLKKPDGVREAPSLPVSALREAAIAYKKAVEAWMENRPDDEQFTTRERNRFERIEQKALDKANELLAAALKETE